MFYIYFAQSLKNNKVYVGKTSKMPEERVREHNTSSSIWTKQNKPFKLIYFESYFCQKDVTHRESFYKSGVGRK